MDRKIVYPAAVPLETDILSTNRFSMVGLGLLTLDILGSATVVSGLVCAATSPASLNVQIAPGRIYSLQNVDGTAYSTLAADITHQILKQGILADPTTIGCAAPSTFGFSINYLIQAAYQDNDTDLVALPYYNVANPQQPFSGPGNNSTPQATTRKGVITIQAKAGIAATTGTQNTPAADAGFVGLYTVTVANGQTSITSANISTVRTAPFINGSFVVTLTGPFAVPVNVTIKYTKFGNAVSLYFPWLIAASGSTTTTTITAPVGSIPNFLIPVQAADAFSSGEATGEFFGIVGNGIIAGGTPGNGNQLGEVLKIGIDNVGAITFFKPSNWPTVAGVNGFSPFTLSYQSA
ncbi:MAG: hypothetical protein JWO52_4030 [Gammaproteobacteria bacterium]|nr:hypothetical protein [Gammaproteobacteria bacterium]